MKPLGIKKQTLLFSSCLDLLLRKFIHIILTKNIKKIILQKLNNLEDIKKKKALFVNFLTLVFKFLNTFLKLDGYISFNLFYFNEKYFEEVNVLI